MKDFPLLRSSRLFLREHRDSDLEFLFEGLSNPEVTRYYDVSYATLEETKEQIKWVRKIETEETGLMWVIVDQETGGAVGTAGVYDIDRKNKKAEIGFWILPAFWGKGMTSEAVNSIHEYCFDVLELNRIEAYVSPANSNSKALLSKLNYTHEGLLRDYESKDGEFVSFDLFSFLRSENR